MRNDKAPGINSGTSGGVGFFGLLAIVFITLKLTGYITWSWWWVLAPIWGSIFAFIILVFVIALVATLKGWK